MGPVHDAIAEQVFGAVGFVRRADFDYSILGNVISIVDLNLGNRSETNDIEHVLRRIEDYYQGSIAGCRIMYRVPKACGTALSGMARKPISSL
jgi:hypothetical protein